MVQFAPEYSYKSGGQLERHLRGQLDRNKQLSLDIDASPLSNENWQNDIPATIKAVNLEIKPDTAYHIDEIKSFIKSHHRALNIDFDNISQKLITNQVLVQNVLNNEYYYKCGSTPF